MLNVLVWECVGCLEYFKLCRGGMVCFKYWSVFMGREVVIRNVGVCVWEGYMDSI